MCIHDLTSQGIFSGDSLGFLQEGSNAIIIVSGFDLELALVSIDKLSAIKPKYIFAAHGTAIREPGEFIESVRKTTKGYGDIILEGLKTGENQEKIAERLMKYHKEHNPDDSRSTLRRFDEIIPWYVAYFKKKGLA
jgi:hypothetical protein